MGVKLGEPLPPGDEHAISVSLPRWADTVGWAGRDPAVLSQLRAGYPRFFVPHVVRDLADELLQWCALTPRAGDGEPRQAQPAALLFPSHGAAEACQRYLQGRIETPEHDAGTLGLVRVSWDGQTTSLEGCSLSGSPILGREIFMVTYPSALESEAKAFWQHAGFGISSRFAVFWRDHAPFLRQQPNGALQGRSTETPSPKEAARAAASIRQRIAGLYSTEANAVGASDVFLYPTGMAAIALTARVLQRLDDGARGRHRVAVFGFLYVDTFKVLGKVHGFDCALYGHGSPSDLDALEQDLQAGTRFAALYTEFPGNPLLGSLDLARLHALSRAYDFFVVVDDTVGCAVNVDLAPLCDVVCTSLTKMFSGACNVMGGSAVLSPQSRHHGRLRGAFAQTYEDTYFGLDVVVMDANSADFAERALAAGRNAERVVTRLRAHRAVASVFYPRGGPTQHLYDQRRRPGGGYGFLLSVRFVSPAAAMAFHDALDVAKGPSLGTNFTLCCAYTLLAHYSELSWAAQYGVVEHLVRISVGVEEPSVLEESVDRALAAAGKHC